MKNSIRETPISYELAKRLNENGFDVPCFNYYEADEYGDYELHYPQRTHPCNWSGEDDITYSAPTYGLVLDWLRQEKDIYVDFPLGYDADSDKGYFFCVVISNLKSGGLAFDTELERVEYTDLNEAVMDAVEYCVDKLI